MLFYEEKNGYFDVLSYGLIMGGSVILFFGSSSEKDYEQALNRKKAGLVYLVAKKCLTSSLQKKKIGE